MRYKYLMKNYNKDINILRRIPLRCKYLAKNSEEILISHEEIQLRSREFRCFAPRIKSFSTKLSKNYLNLGKN